MKIDNAAQAALFIALIMLVVSVLMWVIIETTVQPGIAPWIWGLFVLTSSAITFGVGSWVVERFLNGKIKMLYHSIQSPKGINSKDSQAKPIELSNVQKDVEEWASVKQREIQSLKEQAKFRRDFIGNLAHELKTPIFNMQGYLLTLLEGGLEDSKINYDYLSRADRNLDRLIALVEDLDSISKLEGGREMLKLEKVNLLEVVEEVFQLVEHRAEEKNIDLRFNKKYEKPLWVKADRGKILQVFSNLVLNAIYYGRPDGYCEIRFLDMPQSYMIEVADDGIGVDPEDLPRLFERFYRVDKSRSRNQGGTGLGLAIVKHIIESHGQSINVRSVVNKGTTFSFTLPKNK